jgi:DNA (cytosine-5)-methyltransferase 1
VKLLDLFCGAGGAGMGYHQAGYEVRGIDIKPQPRYPFMFWQTDVMTGVKELDLDRYDLIHASPPCLRWSVTGKSWGPENNLRHPDLVGPIRDILQRWGGPYVIENIPAAPLQNPVRLCGTQFGLGVFRHRDFECSFPVAQPAHSKHQGYVGDGRHFTLTGHPGGSVDGWRKGTLADWRKAIDIDWMLGLELAQAIPPAFTKYIAEQRQK